MLFVGGGGQRYGGVEYNHVSLSEHQQVSHIGVLLT